MTMTATTPINNYTGNGSTTAFAYNFRVLEEADLKVYFDGSEQSSGFVVAGVGDSGGGTVTFSSAPSNGVVVRLERLTTIDRTIDYVEGGGLSSDTLDNDFDRQTGVIQEVDRRAIQEDSDGAIDAVSRRIKNTSDPVNDQDVATKIWAETASTSQVTLATAQATNAATSATNAATSEAAASTSETNASTSETNASTSATNAATSETNATDSATLASGSAAAANANATAAATSETNAATSETNAADSETNASTSETNASTSATNAATSETNAADSAAAAITAITGNDFYDISIQSVTPADSQTIIRFVCARSFDMPINLAGSYGYASTVTTADTEISLQKNDVEFGTMTFDLGSNTATFSAASSTSFVVEDVITAVMPASINELAGMSANIVGVLDLISSDYVDIAFQCINLVPVSDDITQYIATRSITIPSNLTGSYGYASTVTTADTEISLQKNDVEFGTMTFSLGSNTATFSAASSTSFVAGDRFNVVTPANVNELADITITITGSL